MLSNTRMTSHPTPSDAGDALFARLEQRLTDLEIKSAFGEDLLDHLNQRVIEQQAQIDALTREVITLRQQQTDTQPTAFRSLRDELPPHY